jgi:hypothetical protein
MQCFQHQDKAAVGLCKACHKAVCSSCARDTGRGLACSEICLAEVNATNEILDKSKQIYNIGNKSKLPTTGILFYFFFALVCLGVGLYPLNYDKSPEWFLVLMGSGFLVFGTMAYIRTRKLRLNC